MSEYSNDFVFVFGSNLAGRHGAGAALYARTNCGAVYGQGEGFQGNSYAIPTKDLNIETLPLSIIAGGVTKFISFARANPTRGFFVTAIGCGLAGYKPSDIALMFQGVPDNVLLCREFQDVLDERLWITLDGVM